MRQHGAADGTLFTLFTRLARLALTILHPYTRPRRTFGGKIGGCRLTLWPFSSQEGAGTSHAQGHHTRMLICMYTKTHLHFAVYAACLHCLCCLCFQLPMTLTLGTVYAESALICCLCSHA